MTAEGVRCSPGAITRTMAVQPAMRLEVIAREPGDIGEIAEFLQRKHISKIGICHVSNGVSPVDVSRGLLERIPELDVTLYLSMKRFASGSSDGARAAFRQAFEDARKVPVKRILVVSGHPRQTFDSLDALQTIQAFGLAKGTDIAVAYNPFFDPARQRDENERLRRKLAYPFVGTVCLQMGMDTEKLRKAVEFVRSVRSDIDLAGEVPVPSEATLNRLKLLVLYGVFLPNCYFFSLDTAKEMTSALLSAYAEAGIEPTFFSAHLKDIEEGSWVLDG
jgi:hypothetical protein